MKDLRYFDPHRRATWLELFFDLIIVVASTTPAGTGGHRVEPVQRHRRRQRIAGTVLFFLGKQYGYYIEVPELRPYLLVCNEASRQPARCLVLSWDMASGA